MVGRSKNASCRGGISHCLMVSVTQQDPRPLEALKARYGGNIHLDKKAASGEWRQKSNVVWRWRLNNAEAVEFLKQVLPFLIVKKEQAAAAIEWPLGKGGPTGLPAGTLERREAIMKSLVALRQAVKVAA